MRKDISQQKVRDKVLNSGQDLEKAKRKQEEQLREQIEKEKIARAKGTWYVQRLGAGCMEHINSQRFRIGFVKALEMWLSMPETNRALILIEENDLNKINLTGLSALEIATIKRAYKERML